MRRRLNSQRSGAKSVKISKEFVAAFSVPSGGLSYQIVEHSKRCMEFIFGKGLPLQPTPRLLDMPLF